MNKPKTYSLPEVFNNTNLGFTFEFYSSKGTNFIVENLSSVTMKNIILTNGPSYQPTFSEAVLIKEYEGKKPRYSLKLAQQRYDSIIPLMQGVLDWISETSDCTNDTMMRVNMSFDNKHLQTLHSISQMNPQKLILKIDEDYLYERFPEIEYSPYSRSVKELLPMTEAVYMGDLVKNVNYIIGVPKKNFYGINFEDFTRGILEFNYIGGIEYSEKKNDILEVIQYCVIKTYQSLNESDFTKEELNELKKLTEEFYKVQEAFYDPIQFFKLYPEISVMVDLSREAQTIKTYWPKLRGAVFQTVINNKLVEGDINFDTEYGVFQVRKGKLDCTGINNFDLVKCELSGVIENCNLIMCDVDNARIYNSKMVKSNTIKDSYLNGVTANNGNNIDGCFVENNHELLDCNISNSILKFVGLGMGAKLDESTVVIDKDDLIKHEAVGIKVEEIRDYNWVKNLTGKKPEGHVFGNEFIKKSYIS